MQHTNTFTNFDYFLLLPLHHQHSSLTDSRLAIWTEPTSWSPIGFVRSLTALPLHSLQQCTAQLVSVCPQKNRTNQDCKFVRRALLNPFVCHCGGIVCFRSISSRIFIPFLVVCLLASVFTLVISATLLSSPHPHYYTYCHITWKYFCLLNSIPKVKVWFMFFIVHNFTSFAVVANLHCDTTLL